MRHHTKLDNTVRAHIRPGLAVIIVKKEHQRADIGTQGIVQDILTNAPKHPRGIKVRLESGEVGRVQIIEDG